MAEVDERVYIVPLRRVWLKQTRVQRANRAVSALRDFVAKHTKADDVKISQKLNELLWIRGAKKPPGKVKVKVKITDGIATARLPEEMVLVKEEKKSKLGALRDKVTKESDRETGPETVTDDTKTGLTDEEGGKENETPAEKPKSRETPKAEPPKEKTETGKKEEKK